MPTGAAGGDRDSFQLAEILRRDFHLLQKDLAAVLGDAAQRGVAHGARLIMDFLQHEMLEAALLRHDRVPGNVLYLAHHRLAFKIHQTDTGRSHHRQVAIVQEEQIARVVKDGGDVRGDKIFVVAQPDDRRRTIARRDNLVGLFLGNYRQSKDAVEFLHGFAHRLFQAGTVAVGLAKKIILYQMGDDFRIRLGSERVAFFDEPLLERKVVFDDPVVHHHDLAGAVAMGMGVLFRGTPVGRPAGVSDAVAAVERLKANDFFQIAQLAFGAANLHPAFAIAGHGDARRVVAAVFQPLQPVNNDRHNALFPDVPYDSAHKNLLLGAAYWIPFWRGWFTLPPAGS